MTPSRLVYLDTGALLRRAEAAAAVVSTRAAAIAPYVDALLAEPQTSVGCSDIGIIEFHSNLTKFLRSNDRPECDFAWYESARHDLFSLIAAGKIQVVPTPSHCFERAMSLITEATTQHKRALYSWDAVHMIIAAQWAYDSGRHVEIYSADSDFEVPLLVTNFGGRVSVVNLDVLAATGFGRDKR